MFKTAIAAICVVLVGTLCVFNFTIALKNWPAVRGYGIFAGLVCILGILIILTDLHKQIPSNKPPKKEKTL